MPRAVIPWHGALHLILLGLQTAAAQGAWVQKTLAGSSGSFGDLDGAAPAARLHTPVAVAVALDGSTLYFTDLNNHRVRVVRGTAPLALIESVAGSKFPGFADGSGTSATFNAPSGLATVGSTLFVSDTGNHCIRMIFNERIVETLSGSPSNSGDCDGQGSEARFSSPWGIAVDPNGSRLLVADRDNHRVRVITIADGTVNTVTGSMPGYADGTAASARFFFPLSLALVPDVSSFGNFLVVVADAGNAKLRAVDFKGRSVSTLDIPELTESFPPSSVAYCCGRKMVVMDNSSRLMVLGIYVPTLTAFVSDLPRASSGPGTGPAGGLAFGEDGTIYVADARRHVIQSWAADTDEPQPLATCAQGQTCGCGLGNCSCGFVYNPQCKDFCCPCPAGAYCDCWSACNGLAKPCPDGTYNLAGGTSLAACLPCPAGHICQMGATHPVPCPPAHYCPAPTAAKCPVDNFPCRIPCPAGTAGEANSSGHTAEKDSCSECPAGFFSSSQASLKCSPCPPGSYSSSKGSNACRACPAGHFCGAHTKTPQPCPVNSYSGQVSASSAAVCLPCNIGMASREGSPSSIFCIITLITSPTTTPQPTSTATTTSSTLPPVIQTPVPEGAVEPPTILVLAQAFLSGIAGQDAFRACCEIQFVDVLADMLGSMPRIYEMCDTVWGCKQAGRRRSLLQAESVVVKFVFNTSNEMEVVSSILDPSFSNILGSRLSRETGKPQILANVQLIGRSSVVVGELERSPNVPRVTADVQSSSSLFSTLVISVAATVFCCCNFILFRKKLLKICCGKKKDLDESENLEEMQGLQDLVGQNTARDAQRRDESAGARAQAYVAQITSRTDSGSHGRSHSRSSQEQEQEQEPRPNMLSLVVKPPTKIMTRAKVTANTPDERPVPNSLMVAPEVKSGTDLLARQAASEARQAASEKRQAASEAAEPPRAPPVLSFVEVHDSQSSSGLYRSAGVGRIEPSPTFAEEKSRLLEVHASASSACSATSSDNEGQEEQDVPSAKGEVSLDSEGLFELKMSGSPKSTGQSLLDADDLTPMFDMVCHTGDGEAYIDGQDLLEILESLDASADQRAVFDVYASLGMEINSRLSLAKLQQAWQIRLTNQGKHDGLSAQEADSPVPEGVEEGGGGIISESSASLRRKSVDTAISANSWDSD